MYSMQRAHGSPAARRPGLCGRIVPIRRRGPAGSLAGGRPPDSSRRAGRSAWFSGRATDSPVENRAGRRPFMVVAAADGLLPGEIGFPPGLVASIGGGPC
jgi:hypothetical protein